MKRIFILIYIGSIVLSCGQQSAQRPDLNSALRLSEKNRPELEKVLSYYGQKESDSLKLKAAEFLITNMVYHYSVSSELMDEYKREIDSILNEKPAAIRLPFYLVATRKVVEKGNYEMKYDLQTITSDYLIANIEQSFAIWEKSNYYYNITFDEFCESILPYRLKDEPLTLWKDSSLYYYYNFKGSEQLGFGFEDYRNSISCKISSAKEFDPSVLKSKELSDYVLDCIDRAYWDMAIKIPFGIPSTMDLVPHYPTKENRHYWEVVLDNRYAGRVLSSHKNPYAAKVYRETFSFNPIPIDKTNFVPLFFKNPYRKDVTECYENVGTVEYKFNDLPGNCRYAYLSVFNNLEWREVAWCEIRNKKAVFKNMGRDIIYMPTYYNGKDQILGEYPLWFKNTGEVEPLIPNKNEVRKLKLNRKFTYNSSGDYSGNAIIGVQIHGSNDPKIRQTDSMSIISSYNYMAFDTLKVKSDKKYRYWLLKKIKYSNPEFASVKFMKNGEALSPINTFMVGRDGFVEKNTMISNYMFNNNLLEFAGLPYVAGVEFEEPVSVDEVVYITKNDKNGIYPGNIYELFYFDKGEWVSLGRKKAVDFFIEYDNAPINALFWLRNHTEGKEERPFTVNNDKIKFW